MTSRKKYKAVSVHPFPGDPVEKTVEVKSVFVIRPFPLKKNGLCERRPSVHESYLTTDSLSCRQGKRIEKAVDDGV